MVFRSRSFHQGSNKLAKTTAQAQYVVHGARVFQDRKDVVGMEGAYHHHKEEEEEGQRLWPGKQ